jgi:predicted P-loop ATPase
VSAAADLVPGSPAWLKRRDAFNRAVPAVTTDWEQLLRQDKAGPYRDEENIRLVLEHDPMLVGIVRFNEFSGELTLARPIPDSAAVVGSRDTPRRWTDADTVALTAYLQRGPLPKVSRDRVEAALAYFAQYRCAYHPLRDYLQSLKWDGTERVTTWIYDYLGATSAQPPVYLTAVGTAFLVSAVARALEPGCQADCALVLEGGQGIGKSSALRILAGDEWFSDSLPSDLKHKDAKDHLRGKWIVELPELAQFKRNEIETVKAFLSRRHEQFRPSYGRHEITYPRQCVFAGSTNESEYLIDVTGNRRFWCVQCGDIDLASLRRDRDQLWAEAVHLYRQGAPWHLTGDAAAIAAEEASDRVTVDPWTQLVARVIAGLSPMQTDIAPGEVLDQMELGTEQKHPRHAARVASILRDLGWRRGKRHTDRGQLYVRPAA